MRKVIKRTVIALFLTTAAVIVIGIGRKLKEHNLQEEKISRLPSFTLSSLSDSSFHSAMIQEGPLLIVRFHPECEHCQYEISELLGSEILKSDAKVLLISSAERGMVIKFLDQFKLNETPGIIPLLDTAYIFSEVFGSDIVPTNYIYNKKLDLVKVLYGEVKIETILKYLFESE